MSETVLGNALAFALRGYPVLPLCWPIEDAGRLICSCRRRRDCPSPAKHPLGALAPNGLLSATTEVDIVKGWFGIQATGANYGVRCDGDLLVLDIDPRNDGDTSLRRLEAEHGALPNTWRSITGSGGEHILFDAAGLSELKRGKANAVGLGDGVDVPNYIVGAGSRHISGRLYAWNVDHHPHETELARPPAWLVEHLRNDRAEAGNGAGHDPVEWAKAKAHKITEYRDLAVAQVAGKLLRAVSLDPAFAATLVHDWNECHCRPPLNEQEVNEIFARIRSREIQRLERENA